MSSSFQVCIFSKNGCVNDLLRCAPCPPPTFSYRYFRDYALNLSLSLKEVCSIAWRCMSHETDLSVECPIEIPKYVNGKGCDSGCLIAIVLFVILCAIVLVIRVMWLKSRPKDKRENQFECKIIRSFKCGKNTSKGRTEKTLSKKINEDNQPESTPIELNPFSENSEVEEKNCEMANGTTKNSEKKAMNQIVLLSKI